MPRPVTKPKNGTQFESADMVPYSGLPGYGASRTTFFIYPSQGGSKEASEPN